MTTSERTGGDQLGEQSVPATTLAPGSVVIVRDEEWLVTEAEQTADGTLISVLGLSELVRETTASFYTSLDDIRPLDPAAARVVSDSSSRYRTARLWLESTIRKVPVPVSSTDLTVSTDMLADALVYQQTAVRKALDPVNLRPRILLADTVGLGKTLEIGMILAELVRRGRGDRILIVTPKHILEQTQHEMWTRFALPFVRLDSAGIQRVRQKIPASRNPFTFFKRVIISIDTLKSDQYLASLRHHRWDAVVIDESHNVTNTATQNNQLARLLSRQTDALILASATPHNGRRESFAELLRLLDPAAVTPEGDFSDATVDRLVVRRHRYSPEVASEVGADWAERQQPNNILIPASDAENSIATELAETWLFPEPGADPYSGGQSRLFGWTLAKAFLSSPSALAETIRNRLQRIGVDDGPGPHAPAVDREVSALRKLLDLADTALSQRSAKYDALLATLREIGIGPRSPARAVVFAERLATLHWLQDRLAADMKLSAGAVEVLHGGLSDEEQQRVIGEFKQATAPVRILVTGDVASEGVNLHAQCHELIHFDVPWSLIRLEQRNGRIDRYGQRTPPRITALILEPDHDRFRGDLRVLARLVEKENEAHRALGEAASLMGKHSVSGEEEAIRDVLAGTCGLDDVLREVDDVATGSSMDAIFARMGVAGSAAASRDAPAASIVASSGAGDESAAAGMTMVPASASPHTSGLYREPVQFLQEALAQVFGDPAAAETGVSWRRDANHGTARLVPPRDLADRLAVLPQSYLADRRVTEVLQLATSKQRGQQRLEAALADDAGSNWPDAHYLGPLHPVLDWAADRTLASLDRGEVFAVRGDVDHPTVLVVGTLTNRRGHVVASQWPTVTFPNPDNPNFALLTPHADPQEALESVGWVTERTNPGTVPHLADLQHLIAPAVHRCQSQLTTLFGAAEQRARERVETWSARLQHWDAQAAMLVQHRGLRTLRSSVRAEAELVRAMSPDRQLVRPLLVLLPDGGGY